MPTLYVVSAFNDVPAYIEAINADPTANWEKLYRRLILEPVWCQYFAGSELADRLWPLLVATTNDVTWLATAADTVTRSDVRGLIGDAFRQSTTRLPGPDTTVGLFPLGANHAFVTHQMHGVLGFAAGAGKIGIQINPVEGWLDWIPYTVAHEYHHTVWRAQHPHYEDFSLLEYLVFEGRADSFAGLVTSSIVAPWNSALTAVEEQAVWQEMQAQLENRDRAQVLRFMVGGDGIPRSAGYTVGYRIVQRYLQQHPDVAVEQWTALQPEDLLQDSSYG